MRALATASAPRIPRRGTRYRMPKVFISYRRADTGDLCDRLATRLRWALGSDAVFRDVNTILAGSSFPDVLRQGIEACPVMLALIGPEWLTPVGSPPRRRLDDPDDWVRAEIVSALRLGHLVIPVLAEGAPRLDGAALPPDLAPLAQFAALPLRSSAAFDQDVRALLGAIRPHVAWRPASWLTLAVGVYVLLMYIVVAVAFSGLPSQIAEQLTQSPALDSVLMACLEIIIGVFVGWRALAWRQWGWLTAGAVIALSGPLLFVPPPTTSLYLSVLYYIAVWPISALLMTLAGLIGPRPPQAPDTLRARWTTWHTTLAILLGLIACSSALIWISLYDLPNSLLTQFTFGGGTYEMVMLMIAAGCVAAERAFAFGRVWWGVSMVALTVGGVLGAVLPILPVIAHVNGAIGAILDYSNGVLPLLFALTLLVWLTSYSARVPAQAMMKGKGALTR